QADRHADFQMTPGIAEWHPDILWKHDSIALEQHTPRKAMREAAGRVRITLHESHQHSKLLEISGNMIRLRRGGSRLGCPEREENRNVQRRGGHPKRTIRTIIPRFRTHAVTIMRDELDRVQAVHLNGDD